MPGSLANLGGSRRPLRGGLPPPSRTASVPRRTPASRRGRVAAGTPAPLREPQTKASHPLALPLGFEPGGILIHLPPPFGRDFWRSEVLDLPCPLDADGGIQHRHKMRSWFPPPLTSSTRESSCSMPSKYTRIIGRAEDAQTSGLGGWGTTGLAKAKVKRRCLHVRWGRPPSHEQGPKGAAFTLGEISRETKPSSASPASNSCQQIEKGSCRRRRALKALL